MNKSAFFSSSFIIAMGTYLVLEGFNLKFGSFSGPKAGFFPVILGGLLIVLAGILLITTLFKREEGLPPTNLRKILPIFASMIVYGVFVEIAGYLISTFLWFSFFQFLLEPKAPIKALSFGAIASFGSYALFKLLLQGQLPRGLLGIGT
jgi:putative tricarboxylic transport membrane protein